MSPNEKARFEMRDRVLEDMKLSHGAARLYLWLDNLAMFSGVVYPSQKFMAAKFGCSGRYVRMILDELKVRGYLTAHKTGPRPAVYVLSWVPNDRKYTSGLAKKTGSNATKDRNYTSGLRGPHLITETSIETSRQKDCVNCQNTGFVVGSGSAEPCMVCYRGELRIWSANRDKAKGATA